MERMAVVFIVVINLSHFVRFIGATFLVVDPHIDQSETYSKFLLFDTFLLYISLLIEYVYTYELIFLKVFLDSNTYE